MRHPIRLAILGAALLTLCLPVLGSCGGGGGGKKKKKFKIATEVLPKGQDGKAYSATLEGKGGKKPYAWTITAGILPAGLSLDSASGLISGTVGNTASQNSPYPITVELADARLKTLTRDFALTIEPPGGSGGGPPTGTITVTVLEEETSLPLQGAFVMVGDAPDSPFVGNFGTTDAQGEISFTDAALDMPSTPPMVTAGAAGRQYITMVGANASDFTLPLKMIASPTPIARLTGDVTGLSTNPQVDMYAAFVIPLIKLADLFDFRIEKLFVGEHCVCVACAKLALPGNLSYPDQDLINLVAGDDVLAKSYFLDVTDGAQLHLAAMAGHIDVQDLLNFVSGGATNRLQLFTSLTVDGFGFVPNYMVNGPATQNIPFDVPVGALDYTDMMVLGAPRGADTFLVTVADITAGDGTGQIIPTDLGFTPRDGGYPATDTLRTIPDTVPAIGQPYKMTISVAFYDPFSNVNPMPPNDGSLDFAFSFLADRTTPVVQQGTIAVDGFFDLMPLTAANVSLDGRTFDYPTANDASNPASPTPDFTLHQIARAWQEPQAPLTDPYPGTFCEPTSSFFPPDCNEIAGAPPACPPASPVTNTEIYWEVYVPGSSGSTMFTLPSLPPSAPRAADGGTFDEAVTPELDTHRWSVFTFGLTLDPTFDYDSFSIASTDDSVSHVSFNYVEYDPQ